MYLCKGVFIGSNFFLLFKKFAVFFYMKPIPIQYLIAVHSAGYVKDAGRRCFLYKFLLTVIPSQVTTFSVL